MPWQPSPRGELSSRAHDSCPATSGTALEKLSTHCSNGRQFLSSYGPPGAEKRRLEECCCSTAWANWRASTGWQHWRLWAAAWCRAAVTTSWNRPGTGCRFWWDPHTENFRDIIHLFQVNNAVCIVAPPELTAACLELLSNDDEKISRRARELETLRAHSGATQATLRALSGSSGCQ